MIKEIVKLWEERKQSIEVLFEEKLLDPDFNIGYPDLVKIVLEKLKEDFVFNPNLENITVINHDSYSGTMVFVMPDEEHWSKFYYIMIDYGSCSGCDALEHAINGLWFDEISDKEKVIEKRQDSLKALMSLSLHIVQRLKIMNDE